MPIFDQGYQNWTGKLAHPRGGWWTIARRGVLTQLQKKGMKFWLFAATLPALALSAFLVVWGLLEQQSSLLAPLMFLLRGLPDSIKTDPQAYRLAVWTMSFNLFFTIQMFFSFILVLTVGPDLISQDLRFNAIPLYFSRPLTRLGYFLGKFGVIAVYVAAVTIAPMLLGYVLGLAFSLDLTVIRDTWKLMLAGLGYGAIVVVSMGALMLALSSLSRNSRYVAAMWVGLFIVGDMTSQALERSVGEKWCPMVSYANLLASVREKMLGTDEAWKQLTAVFQVADDPRARFIRAQVEAQAKAQEKAREGEGGRRNRPRRFQRETRPLPPWDWSALALGGLVVVSAGILSTRVRSLDRLK